MFAELFPVTAPRAFCHAASAAIVPNSGRAAAHFITVRRFTNSTIILLHESRVDGLKTLDNVIPAMFVTRPRPLAGAIQIYAVPALIADLLQNAMAGREIDISVAKIVNALEEFGVRRILLLHFAVRQDKIRLW